MFTCITPSSASGLWSGSTTADSSIPTAAGQTPAPPRNPIRREYSTAGVWKTQSVHKNQSVQKYVLVQHGAHMKKSSLYSTETSGAQRDARTCARVCRRVLRDLDDLGAASHGAAPPARSVSQRAHTHTPLPVRHATYARNTVCELCHTRKRGVRWWMLGKTGSPPLEKVDAQRAGPREAHAVRP